MAHAQNHKLIYLYFTCICALVFILEIMRNQGSVNQEITVVPKNTDEEKQIQGKRIQVILIYSKVIETREWPHLPEREAKTFASRCRFSNCEVTYDNNRINESDVVIFHGRDMPPTNFLIQYSRTARPKYQRWAYYILENPLNTPDRRPLDGLFNWTMTYRKESDIWLPYKKYHKIQESEEKTNTKDYAAEKNKVPNRKLAFWVLSHCGTYRDEYARKLQEYISIDVAGGCAGNFKNPIHNCNSEGRDGCFEHIRNYKFYLAFENAFCDQYVTEKYWYNSLEFDAVPIVMGGGPYDDPKVAIPRSFINVEDFGTVKALADYLNYLDKNDTAYNEYFNWKNEYKLDNDLGWPFPDIFVCEICKKLHTEDSRKTYDRLSDFWSWGHCKKNEDTKVFQILKRS